MIGRLGPPFFVPRRGLDQKNDAAGTGTSKHSREYSAVEIEEATKQKLDTTKYPRKRAGSMRHKDSEPQPVHSLAPSAQAVALNTSVLLAAVEGTGPAAATAFAALVAVAAKDRTVSAGFKRNRCQLATSRTNHGSALRGSRAKAGTALSALLCHAAVLAAFRGRESAL